MLAAIRWASSRVMSFAAERLAGFILEIDIASACPLWSRTMKHSWPSFVRVIDRPGRRELGLQDFVSFGRAIQDNN
jgi:hypothetical protein